MGKRAFVQVQEKKEAKLASVKSETSFYHGVSPPRMNSAGKETCLSVMLATG